MDHVTLVMPLSGTVCREKANNIIDIASKHTKFDDASFSRSEDISWGVYKILQESPLPLIDPRDPVTQRMLNIPYRIIWQSNHFFYPA